MAADLCPNPTKLRLALDIAISIGLFAWITVSRVDDFIRMYPTVANHQVVANKIFSFIIPISLFFVIYVFLGVHADFVRERILAIVIAMAAGIFLGWFMWWRHRHLSTKSKKGWIQEYLERHGEEVEFRVRVISITATSASTFWLVAGNACRIFK
ncbi:hypothetical protein [Azospirillum sp. Sh1]|uniref:hypothetical protein n=1 Tax=Azospirillum sp. Sh1 TaxID=2607285 RepID=UPI0011EC2550|nr:hypothetical protein [Azospirillum sp. Sh1]KAA0582842.1 hypothetical protein FZ029_01770 [Azospirillum sp. Sh1]